jgi:RNA polymerase sigma-70 factor (ECF subfamily)
MARNEAFKAIKKRSGQKAAPFEEGLLEAVAPEKRDEPALSPKEAEQALAGLPVEQREVVVLKIYEGFTFAQIGELTEVSPNTAASRYRYALAKLEEKIARIPGST